MQAQSDWIRCPNNIAEDTELRTHFVQGFALISILLSVGAVLAAEPSSATKPAPEQPIDDSRLTVANYFDMESVSDPRISPDGERIVYVRTWADIKTDKRYSNLWIVDFDGQHHRPLTSGKVSDTSPRWSPSGDRLCYISGDETSSQLYVMWMDSGRTAKITNLQKAPATPEWSPDGLSIAFVMQVSGKKPDGVKMPEKPEGAAWADPPTVIDRLVYRFDARGYLPAGFKHIFVVPAEGGTERQMTSGDYDHGAPEWSRDGMSILFSAIRKPDAEWIVGDSEIYSVSLADRAIKAITTREGPDENPNVSPKGDRIAYTGFDEKHLSYAVTRLYTMNPDGTNARCLSTNYDNDTYVPRWQSDGKGVVFASGGKGLRHLYTASLNGEIKQVTSGEVQIMEYDLGAKDRVAAVIATAGRPADIYSFTLKKPGPRRLTFVNEDVLGHKQLGQLEEMWYESSFDHKKIQGWLLKPPGFDAKKKYPLILYIHGGPHAMYGISFEFEFQTLAAKDYLVFFCNPRGSTGYGQEFGNIIQYKYPGDDFFDLESGVDEVIKRGIVDDKNLFVTGGSGGGVLTCWVVGRTQRYRAAVSQYPVINWYSWAGTADIGYSAGSRWFEKWPWEDTEALMKRSPINFVGKVTTPVMLITGESDWRTPISETEQYYRALKIQKKEAVMVRMPGEAHGVRGRPSHFVAKMLFIREWFDKHKAGQDASAKEAKPAHE